VVLDATAPVTLLRALRPDCVVEDIRVVDGGEVDRVLLWRGMARTTLGKAKEAEPDRFEAMLVGAGARVRRLLHGAAVRLGRPPKVAVFTYRSYLPDVKRFMALDGEVDWHYFGNTRGYDHWFQDGFDCFVTVGDPYTNLDATTATSRYLFGDDGNRERMYFRETSEAEAAQAHGRARDPQPGKGGPYRLHVHVGQTIPLGWDSENSSVEI
jgi:hypothetical protein